MNNDYLKYIQLKKKTIFNSPEFPDRLVFANTLGHYRDIDHPFQLYSLPEIVRYAYWKRNLYVRAKNSIGNFLRGSFFSVDFLLSKFNPFYKYNKYHKQEINFDKRDFVNKKFKNFFFNLLFYSNRYNIDKSALSYANQVIFHRFFSERLNIIKPQPSMNITYEEAQSIKKLHYSTRANRTGNLRIYLGVMKHVLGKKMNFSTPYLKNEKKEIKDIIKLMY